MFKLTDGFNQPVPLNGEVITPGRSVDFKYGYNGVMIPDWCPTAPSTLVDFQTWFNARFSSKLGTASGAYLKFSPLKPRVDMGQTLAEIREVPAMLKTTARYFLDIWTRKGGFMSRRIPWYSTGRNHASMWLNVNFGWLPFLGTIRDFYKTTENVTSIIQRLRDHNGLWEKRGGIVEKIESREPYAAKTSATTAWVYPVLNNALGVRSGKSDAYVQISQIVKFSARYKYYIPELLPNGKWPVALIARLYGLELSPRLVWDLIPYSWLVDWCFHLGNIIEAATPSKFGQLVTNGAYLTDQATYKYMFSAIKRVGDTYGFGSWSCDIDRKQRFVSPSPYGFDIPFEGLSSWQLSILTALGFNRLTKLFTKR